MSLRVVNLTKCLWCLIAIQSGTFWGMVKSVSPKPTAHGPDTVQAQAKYFQDFFSVQLSPYKTEYGHVCEDPDTWEQRYERKDFQNHRHMGKVRWGDKKGGYGEHYWDLNHAGGNNDNTGDNGDDDGSYNEAQDAYEEPSVSSLSYDSGDGPVYDAEKMSQSPYDETGRAKRADSKIKAERKVLKVTNQDHPQSQNKPANRHYNRDQVLAQTKNYEDTSEDESYDHEKSNNDDDEEEETTTTTRKPIHRKKPQKIKEPEDYSSTTTPEDITENPYIEKEKKQNAFVPYEQGAGFRQQYPSQYYAPSVPRLFLEPSTGHVVDRATGQAFILQPIIPQINNYNQGLV